MSCPSWQWHRTGSRRSPVLTLPVAPLWRDLEFFPNSRGNKAAANLSPVTYYITTLPLYNLLFIIVYSKLYLHFQRPQKNNLNIKKLYMFECNVM